ncbi:4,5-DOPA dioxygenase extradiol [Nakamurella sp. UYEF19]|uniref:dioxygenase family protein n=1 Tax=Nakamurella sp. UYEF19 TaxID=1756392 RepID=UPI0033973692
MSSPVDLSAPAGAYDAFLPAAVQTSREQRLWSPADGALPSLYLGHGAPPLLDDPLWIDQLFAWGQGLPKPKAILIVSAHWEQAPISLSAHGANTPLVYDFGGFARRFFTLQYNTPDAGTLAATVRSKLADTTPVHQHTTRGLDHGAWIPLMIMYPLGDVPVLQLSMPTEDPAALVAIGGRLRELREEGVLIVGSGFMTHGLPYLTQDAVMGRTLPGWSADFDQWAAEALAQGDVETLARFRSQAPGMPYAHPTAEHFLPLFVTLGAAGNPEKPVDTTIEGFAFGLSKRSIAVS